MTILFFYRKNYKIKYLTNKKQKSFGRNNYGRITSRARGGGIKKNLYKIIDNNYVNYGLFSTSALYIKKIYDFFRFFYIGVYYFLNGILKGTYRYFLLTKNVKLGSQINFGFNVPTNIGNVLPLYRVSLGQYIHSIETKSKHRSTLVKNAKSSAVLLSLGLFYATVKLPSGEIKLLPKNLFCVLGQLLIIKKFNKNATQKAGFKRKLLSIRPIVRGAAMNACDHPHGGGEGKAPIGYKFPRTCWGKPFKGIKTRKKTKVSTKFIIQTRL